MKRIVTLVLLVSLMLCACAPAQQPSETTAAPTTVETIPETTGETTEETTEASAYIHPLNGQELTEPYTGRLTAVVINNAKACLPQYGISKADMIFEFEVEGSVTRMMAVFSSFEGVDVVGPIRSARTYFNNVSTGYDAPLVHCGGSDRALKGFYDYSNKIDNWVHINQMSNGKYFYRDQTRKAQGYATEHTLFTTGEKLQAVLEAKELNTVSQTGRDFGLNFAKDAAVAGESAEKITVKFRGNKKTEFTYNEQTGLYEAYQLKQKHIDGGTGERMAYRNVLALSAKQEIIFDGDPHTYYDLIGSGEGFCAIGGKITQIKWSRESLNKPFQYTLADGSELILSPGKTYVGVISSSLGTVTAE